MDSDIASFRFPTRWKIPTFTQAYALFTTFYLLVMIGALLLDSEESRRAMLDLIAQVGGPLAAAIVAWLGVNHTVINSRRLEVLKEWHTDLRWACELCTSGDNHPDLGEPEQDLIDAALIGLTEPI